jgi:hypothetical protein
MKKILEGIAWGILAFMVFYALLGICGGIYVLISHL